MLLENPSLLALQSEIRFQSEHPSMHFLLDSEASKQLWLALMKKSCFASLFGYCYVLSLLLLCCKGRKNVSEFRKVGARSARDRRGAFDGFQTRILFISVSSSSLLEPISVDDEESARSPRWKVLVCWHSSSFILSRRERKLFHFLLPFHSLGPRVAEFSPETFVSAHHLPSQPGPPLPRQSDTKFIGFRPRARALPSRVHIVFEP